MRPFVEAMLIGVTVGAYSSIFIASQLLVSWAKGKDRQMLPEGETAPIMPVSSVPPMTQVKPQPAVVNAGGGVATTAIPSSSPASTESASREAIQRARQVGKTSKRRR